MYPTGYSPIHQYQEDQARKEAVPLLSSTEDYGYLSESDAGEKGMTAIYEKYPVQEEQCQIRLVNVFAGQFGDPLRCSLEVVSLNEGPRYEALSYVWGYTEHKAYITLNDRQHKISSNLFHALKTFRHPEESRTLWVDAICINQENNLEKTWQVDRMGEIYKNCMLGLLWIGRECEACDKWCMTQRFSCCNGAEPQDPDSHSPCGNPKSDPGPGRGHEISKEETGREDSSGTRWDGCHPDCQWHGRQPRISTLNQVVEMLNRGLHLDEITPFKKIIYSGCKLTFEDLEPIFALGAFLNRSWWTRSWTVQEAALPPNSKIYCGNLEFSLRKMATAAENLYRHSQTCCSKAFTCLAQDLDPDMSYGEATINILFKFQKCFNTLKLARTWVTMPDISFLDFLYSFHDRQAKDPRDKIYALLGMLTPKFGFPADYTITWEELNKRLSSHLLNEHPDRQLSVFWRESPPLSSSPSWAKDFSRETTAFNRRMRGEWYEAGTKRRIQIQRYGDVELSASGVKVDVLSHLSTKYEIAHTYCIDEFRSIFDWAQFLRQTISCDPSLKVAFGKTLSGDVHTLDESYAGFSEQALNDFVRSHMGEGPSTEFVDTNLAQELNISAAGRKLFVTKQGRIGLGPSWMQQGDEVWVLFGSSVPFILRRMRDLRCEKRSCEGDPVHDHHIVIGDCYVHGIMFGEAVDDSTEEQIVYLR